jgi:FMN phosphatase YigB (HAD superfamily)
MKEKSYKPVIVIDAGRVLVDIDPDRVLSDLSRRSGRHIEMPPPDDLDTMFLPLYVGERSWPDLLETINQALGLSLAADEWRDIWCSIIIGEVPGMRQALSELKSEFKLVALSNTDEVHWNYILNNYPISQLLDGWVVSFEQGIIKPDPDMYQRVVDRYCDGRPPFFYTDDNPRYVEAARLQGWDAEVFLDAAHFRQEVARRRRNNPPS